MKRSEMLAIIRATIRNHSAKFGIEENLKDLSEDILKTQETMGMLPPCRDADMKSSYGYAKVWLWEKE